MSQLHSTEYLLGNGVLFLLIFLLFAFYGYGVYFVVRRSHQELKKQGKAGEKALDQMVDKCLVRKLVGSFNSVEPLIMVIVHVYDVLSGHSLCCTRLEHCVPRHTEAQS